MAWSQQSMSAASLEPSPTSPSDRLQGRFQWQQKAWRPPLLRVTQALSLCFHYQWMDAPWLLELKVVLQKFSSLKLNQVFTSALCVKSKMTRWGQTLGYPICTMRANSPPQRHSGNSSVHSNPSFLDWQVNKPSWFSNKVERDAQFSGTAGSLPESWWHCRKELNKEESSPAAFSGEKTCREGIGTMRVSLGVDKLIIRR